MLASGNYYLANQFTNKPDSEICNEKTYEITKYQNRQIKKKKTKMWNAAIKSINQYVYEYIRINIRNLCVICNKNIDMKYECFALAFQ